MDSTFRFLVGSPGNAKRHQALQIAVMCSPRPAALYARRPYVAGREGEADLVGGGSEIGGGGQQARLRDAAWKLWLIFGRLSSGEPANGTCAAGRGVFRQALMRSDAGVDLVHETSVDGGLGKNVCPPPQPEGIGSGPPSRRICRPRAPPSGAAGRPIRSGSFRP
jgi:hypothetical protein